jgi:hypothetical protein
MSRRRHGRAGVVGGRRRSHFLIATPAAVRDDGPVNPITSSARREGEMLRVDPGGPGGLILGALAFVAGTTASGVLIWAAFEFRWNGRRGPLVVALPAALLVLTMVSMLSKTFERRGVSVLRPEALQALSSEEAAARLPQKLEEYCRLRRRLRWVLIAFFGTVVVLVLALVLMLVAPERWPMLVATTMAVASVVGLQFLTFVLLIFRGELDLWLCPWCGRQFGHQGAFKSGPHKCKYFGYAIDLA